MVTYVFAVDTGHQHADVHQRQPGAAPVVVMDNVEDMQVTYGVDTDGDGRIDSYQTADGLDSAQVAAVA